MSPWAACGSHVCGRRSHRYASLDPPAPTWRYRCHRWHQLAFVLPVAVVTIFSLHVPPPLRNGGAIGPPTSKAAAGDTSFAAVVDGVKVKVCNSYGDGMGTGTGTGILERRPNKSDGLAEPYRTTTLQIEAWPGTLQAVESEEFRWEINGEFVGVGVTLETLFETVGIHQVRARRRRRGTLTLRSNCCLSVAQSVLQYIYRWYCRQTYGTE
ncbi:unnamed protein product [Ectocarpus sp. 12 AP-2014]